MPEYIRSLRHQSPLLKRQADLQSQFNNVIELEITVATAKRNLEEANEEILSLKENKR